VRLERRVLAADELDEPIEQLGAQSLWPVGMVRVGDERDDGRQVLPAQGHARSVTQDSHFCQ
jgi:hypothetical protein